MSLVYGTSFGIEVVVFQRENQLRLFLSFQFFKRKDFWDQSKNSYMFTDVLICMTSAFECRASDLALLVFEKLLDLEDCFLQKRK